MYAGFWKRFFAYLLDYVVVYVGTMIIVVLTTLLGTLTSLIPALGSTLYPSVYTFHVAQLFYGLGTISRLFVLFSIGWLYYAVMESSKFRGTVGKLALGIIVVDEHNEKITFGRASARYWSRIITFFTIFVGYIMAAFTAKKQALHDKIARTYVVNKNWLDYSDYIKQNPPLTEMPVPAPAPGVNRLSISLNKEE
ncbi:RDD family protein [Paenibacillus peoriae]|uniref:RDD family protein n=1 Tax=Paenibacillus peoriae TaxID=59893 RepID=UPI00026C65BC|nr:RDD family protein [Paenibacillus peoriae]MEC0182954.1 RDD family protein [Paenibacillus peoriae]